MSATSPSHTPTTMAAPPSSASLSQSNLNLIDQLDSQPQRARSEHGSESVKSTPTSPPENPAQSTMRRKGLHQMLARTRSTRTDETHQPRVRPQLEVQRPSRERIAITNPRTAPLVPESGFHDAMASQARNRSADRHAVIDSDEESLPASSAMRSATAAQGPSLYSSFMHNSSRAATGIGKAGKGLFGKFTRSGSGTGDRHGATTPTLDNYVFKVIDTPLVDQTRKTRIKRSLKGAGDKTEFWMPSLPYRCIDYLNSHGVDSEGLYRVPGSSKEVKYWKMRFDSGPDYDVDLLSDTTELYDINVVGSMLKDWLRNLPEPLLPKATQSRILDQCTGATRTPQLMRDELSRLPPFNYYLLFALTCHISLLHSHASENKMNYNNLCICFQPCIQIDAFCFQFLVMDWRNCWQGCWTELEYYQQEMALIEAAEAEQDPTPAKRAATKQGNSQSSSGPAPPSRERVTSPTSSSHQRRQPSQQTQTTNGSADQRTRSAKAGSDVRSKSHSPNRQLPPAPPAGSPTPKEEPKPFAQDMASTTSSKRQNGPPTLGPMTPMSPMQI